MGKNVHTVPDGDSWKIKVGGKSTGRRYPTQTKAAEAGRKEAQKQQSEHYIHRPDGSIRDADSYGNDPHPPDG